MTKPIIPPPILSSHLITAVFESTLLLFIQTLSVFPIVANVFLRGRSHLLALSESLPSDSFRLILTRCSRSISHRNIFRYSGCRHPFFRHRIYHYYHLTVDCRSSTFVQITTENVTCPLCPSRQLSSSTYWTACLSQAMLAVVACFGKCSFILLSCLHSCLHPHVSLCFQSLLKFSWTCSV